MSTDTTSLWLFVRLAMKPDAMSGYLAAMRDEAHGARSETINGNFDMFIPDNEPHTLCLLENWASKDALLNEHAKQPYYQRVRGMEADCLTGDVDEWEMSACPPLADNPGKSMAGPWMRMTTLHATDADVAELLDTVWQIQASALHEAKGNVAAALFRRNDDAGARLLVESWQDDSAAASAWTSTDLASLRAALDDIRWDDTNRQQAGNQAA